jgi:hypothetical protein
MLFVFVDIAVVSRILAQDVIIIFSLHFFRGAGPGEIKIQGRRQSTRSHIPRAAWMLKTNQDAHATGMLSTISF